MCQMAGIFLPHSAVLLTHQRARFFLLLYGQNRVNLIAHGPLQLLKFIPFGSTVTIGAAQFPHLIVVTVFDIVNAVFLGFGQVQLIIPVYFTVFTAKGICLSGEQQGTGSGPDPG